MGHGAPHAAQTPTSLALLTTFLAQKIFHRVFKHQVDVLQQTLKCTRKETELDKQQMFDATLNDISKIQDVTL